MKRKRCRNLAAFLVMGIALIAVFCLNPEVCLAEEEESDRVPYLTDWGIFDEATGTKISLADSGVAAADTTEAVFYVEFDHNVAQNSVADLNCSLISVMSNSGSPVASYAWVKDTQLEFQFRRCIFITVTGIDPSGYYHISVAPGITAKNGFTNTSGTELYFAFPSSGTDYGSGDGGDEGDPSGEGGGNEENPPSEGGGNEDDPPEEGGGNEENPPGEGGGNEENPSGEDGGNEKDPSGEDDGNEENPPKEDGGNEENPPGEKEQNIEDPEKTPSDDSGDNKENDQPETTVPEETDNDPIENDPPENHQQDAVESVESESRTEETASANAAAQNPLRSAEKPEIKPDKQENVNPARQRLKDRTQSDRSKSGAEIGSAKTAGSKTKTEMTGYRIDAGIFTSAAITTNTDRKASAVDEAAKGKAASNRTRLLLITAVLAIAAFGAVSEELSFRRRIRRR